MRRVPTAFIQLYLRMADCCSQANFKFCSPRLGTDQILVPKRELTAVSIFTKGSPSDFDDRNRISLNITD